MYVIKRDGVTKQPICFDKITNRIKNLTLKEPILEHVEPILVAQRVVSGLYSGVSTIELDNLAAEIAVNMGTTHPEYETLASRITISNLHKNTYDDYGKVCDMLYNYINPILKQHAPLINKECYDIIKNNIDRIQAVLDYEQDYTYDYLGIKTLLNSYLIKIDKQPVERIQHLLMRVAIGVHRNDIDSALKSYHLLSQKCYTLATPTLFNAGTPNGQLSSCYLLAMKSDSIEGIYDTLKQIALISKGAGGIGFSVHDVRAKNSYIKGTNGTAEGLVPMLRVFNDTARYVSQGGNKRKGAFACFLKDTEVFTSNEGVKKIQDVKVGDLVVTHKNRLRPVIQTHKNPVGDRKIYKLQVDKNKDVYVTGNHRFWSFYTKKYKSNKLSLGWNSIEELKNLMDNKNTTRQTCYVSMPLGTDIQELKKSSIDVMDFKDIIVTGKITDIKLLDSDKLQTISKTVNSNGKPCVSVGQIVNRIWSINEDLANFIGMWLGDGHIRRRTKDASPIGIGITIDKNNHEEINYIRKIAKDIFGCNITEHIKKTNNVTNITINCSLVGIIFNELFGSHFDGKKLPNMIFSWPKNLINSLIAGLITTDGHISKKCNVTLGLSNKNLINQIYHLCRNNGIDVSFVEGKIYPGMTTIPYTISIPLNKNIINQTHKFYKDDRLQKCKEIFENNNVKVDNNYLKILNIEEINSKEEYVYTLGVEEDHSYTVEGLIVENCYLELWHADIEDFLELRKNGGKEEMRARDLFYAMWLNDLFFERVEKDQDWSLFCPNECPGLSEVYGEEFVKLYKRYESEGRARKVIKAQDLYMQIIVSQIETGLPYMVSKDRVNQHNNQSNLGTIKCSNLCVSGDTFILTDKGQIPIKELVDQEVNLWNGEEWSKSLVRQTGIDQEMLKVTFSNGVELKCTPYHKFHLLDGTIKDAQQLSINDTLIKYNLPECTIDCNSLVDPSIETLRNIRLLLQTKGVDSYIKEHENNYELYPFNSKIQVISIEKTHNEDTFCFNEPKRHMGMFNGILTGNCSEIVQYTDEKNVACCNLSSISLPACIKNGVFDHQTLYDIAYHAIKDLNRVIDINNYPIPEAKFSNLNNRPVGLGLQGLADLFILLRLPFDSPEARVLNQEILETMYYAAARSSCDLAKIEGYYPTFPGSPTSKGILCPDSWEHTPTNRWPYNELRQDIVKYGLRNSLLIALMPTVSTAIILGNNESFEPINTNIYVKRTLAGEYTVINKYLIKDLINLGLWNEELKQRIIQNNGSVQGIKNIPEDIQLLYRTVWEVPLKAQIDMQSDRGVFVDQSQSFNVHMAAPTKAKLSSLHFYSWKKKGIKTLSYYIRSRSVVDPIKFTVDKQLLERVVIYTKPTCKYCVQAKELLKAQNLKYIEYNIEEPQRKIEFDRVTNNAKTVPQIFIDGELIGGYTELYGLYNQNAESEGCTFCSS